MEGLAEEGDPSLLASTLSSKPDIYGSGAFNTPVGASYEFTFMAEEGSYLSLATMLVQSNDLFFSPSDRGIALFNGPTPIRGNISDSFMLYDAGTEVNELPGVGLHQPARLNGGEMENGLVRTVDDAFSYPAVTEMVKITITSM